MKERKQEGGVKVVDRRKAAQADDAPAEAMPQAPSPAAPQDAPPEADRERDPSCDEPIPAIDVVTFVLSLSTNGMVSLGLLPSPGTEEKKLDLPLARQTIDILALLQEKTKGNLTGEEERILDNVVYDLRMTYVQVVRERC
jgi:hypothetical protein